MGGASSLNASGYAYTPELQEKVVLQVKLQKHTVLNTLPNKSFRKLIGREALQKRATAVLADLEGGWLLGIDGMGGIGKTALALDLIENCQRQNRFQHIIWLSAAISGEDTFEQSNNEFTFDFLLNNIGLHLGLQDLAALPTDEKIKRLQTKMGQQPTFIVLDNLETAVTPQDELIAKIRPLLNPSKALLTSRKRFRGELHAIHLDGLDMEQSAAFIKQDALEKGIPHLENVDPEDLEAIVKTTGGSPLALKLVVSQLAYLPLDVVLQNLQTATSFQHDNNQGEYVQFYKHVFLNSWNLLDDAGKQLLVAMTHFGTDSGTPFAAIQHASDLPQNILINSIDHLWRLSLLEIREGQSLRQIRYYLHPLTQHFVLSDIVKII